jgi:hypothetical protein
MTEIKSIPTDLIDASLSGYQQTEHLMGENGVLKQLTKAAYVRHINDGAFCPTQCHLLKN